MSNAFLSEAEAGSQVWHKIKERYTKRLDSLRRKNDGQLNAEETAALRGKISEIKNLLALDQDGPALAPAASDD